MIFTTLRCIFWPTPKPACWLTGPSPQMCSWAACRFQHWYCMARWITYRTTLDPQLALSSIDTTLVTTSSDGLDTEKCTAGEYSNSCCKVSWWGQLPAGWEENIIYRHPSAELRAKQTPLQNHHRMWQTDTLVLQDNSGSFWAKRKKERPETGLGTVTGSGKGSWLSNPKVSQPMYYTPTWKAHIISQPAWWLSAYKNNKYYRLRSKADLAKSQKQNKLKAGKGLPIYASVWAWIVSLKNSCPPEPQNGTLLGNRVFAFGISYGDIILDSGEP